MCIRVVEWSSHEPEPGVLDFSGNHDLEAFITAAQDQDLLVILRVGPFICAERDMVRGKGHPESRKEYGGNMGGQRRTLWIYICYLLIYMRYLLVCSCYLLVHMLFIYSGRVSILAAAASSKHPPKKFGSR